MGLTRNLRLGLTLTLTLTLIGGAAWASWALLPAYEASIMFKKVGLVIWLVGSQAVSSLPPYAASTAVAYAVSDFAGWIYNFTYFTVIYVLSAQSAGTVTFRRAIGTTFMLALVMAVIDSLEHAGYVNHRMVSENTIDNATRHLWPSFGGDGPSGLSSSVPGHREIDKHHHADAAMNFWLGTTQITLGVITAVLISFKLLPHPRQLGLVTVLYSLLVTIQILEYLSFWHTIARVFGFNPFVLFGVVEMPLKYYIMLLDSRVTCPATPP